MKTAAAVIGMLASAALGAAVAGWIVSTHAQDVRERAMPVLPTAMLPPSGPGGFPIGDIAGGGDYSGLISMPNPLGEDAAVVEQGHQLFIRMNCAGCHGYQGKGGMGPDLTDDAWRYGGAPAQIYNSIAEGRPKGMPAWGRALPPELIWKMTAYVHAMGGGVPAAQAAAGMVGDYRHGEAAGSGAVGGAQRRGGRAGDEE